MKLNQIINGYAYKGKNMNISTKIIGVFILICFVNGCSTNKNTYNSFTKIYETNTPLEQAVANCNYELQLSKEADTRSGMDNGILRQILMEKTGMYYQRQQLCLKKYGWEMVEKERTTNLAPKTKLILANGEFGCNITKNVSGGVINTLKITSSSKNLYVNLDKGIDIPFVLQDFTEQQNYESERTYIKYSTPNKDTNLFIYNDMKFLVELGKQSIEGYCNLKFL